MNVDTDPVAHVEVQRRGVVGGVGEAGQRAALGRGLRARRPARQQRGRGRLAPVHAAALRCTQPDTITMC